MKKKIKAVLEMLKHLPRYLSSTKGAGKKDFPFYVKPDTLSREYENEPIIYLSRSSCNLHRVGNNDLVTISYRNLRIPAKVKVAGDQVLGSRHCQLNRLSSQALDTGPGHLINITPPESLVLLMDTSKSMLGLLEDKQPKLSAAKEAAAILIKNKIALNENDLIGMVTFGEKRMTVKLTADLESILCQLNMIEAGGKTYMYGGLQNAMDALRDATGLKRIILVTDGVPSSTGQEQIFELTEKKIAGDTVIDTVGVGNRRLANNNIYSLNAYNEKFLKSIAALTGGQFAFVYDVERFKRAFVKLAEAKRLFAPKKYIELDEHAQ